MKIKNSIWLAILIILSFPISFAFGIITDRELASSFICDEFIPIFIVAGVSFVFLVGIISFVVYRILRWKKIASPGKTALMVYSILLSIFAIIATGSFLYPNFAAGFIAIAIVLGVLALIAYYALIKGAYSKWAERILFFYVFGLFVFTFEAGMGFKEVLDLRCGGVFR